MSSYKKEYSVIIWGTGRKFHSLEQYINFEEILCFVEQDERFRRSEENFNYIDYPEELCNIQFDFLLISSEKYYVDITKDCIFEYGIDFKKIMSLEAYICSRNGLLIDKILTNYQRINNI